MFSDVTKILDRNFIVGFFLPSIILSFFLLCLLNSFDLLNHFSNLFKFIPVASQELKDGKYQLLFLSILSFCLSLLLMEVNLHIYRICEGYVWNNRFSIARYLEIRRFRRLKCSLSTLDKRVLFSDFPSENDILPTAFGNVIRAFETYSKDVYGAEAIAIWFRLLSVIPPDFRENLNSEKSSVDFWVNIWAGNLFLSSIYLFLIFYTGKYASIFFPISFALSAFISAKSAKSAAISWGENVKSSFDIFLPDLQKKLGFSVSMTRKQEFELWQAISQTFLYGQLEAGQNGRSWWDEVADLVRNQAVEDETIIRYKDGSGK